jgi:hypothetical protein
MNGLSFTLRWSAAMRLCFRHSSVTAGSQEAAMTQLSESDGDAIRLHSEITLSTRPL